jgi:YrbI family 3-deoxy-D-manno-octulosonate 8-phosphate phosphatase
VDEPADLEVISDLLAIRRSSNLGTAVKEFSEVRLLVLDFDGVMTDNRVLVDQNGNEAVLCNRSDGWGIARLKETGVEVLVLSTEANPVVSARCRKLSITAVQDCSDKLTRLQELAEERGLTRQQIAYVGNDVNDLDCLRWVGFPIAVADALPEVRTVARFVTSLPGGFGAVREITEWIQEGLRGAAIAPAQPVASHVT